MRGAPSLALGCAVALLAVPASAAPVDGKVEQSVHDTVYQALVRNGWSGNSAEALATLGGVQTAIADATAAGGTPHASGATWNQTLKGLADWLPWPFRVGKEGERFQGAGGSFGGGGATGSWDDATAAAGRDCGDVEYGFDPQGNFIIPSYALKVGTPVNVGSAPGLGDQFARASASTVSPQPTATAANEAEAAVRRLVHNVNISLIPQAWYGVVGPTSPSGCYAIATVAYRNTAGTVVGRSSHSVCTQSGLIHEPAGQFEGSTSPQQNPHTSCPQGAEGSADFHFYGLSNFGSHYHQCVHYLPNRTLSPDGYAINPKTTVTYASVLNWPNDMPGFIKQCGLDAGFIKKLAEALWKKAAAKPGYTGVPPKAVTDADSRPGTAKVEDLGDTPATGAQPTPDPNAPPPTNNPGTGGGTDTCDFGPTGCTDPGTAAPTLDEPATNIMDPIFDWMPDLPSLTFNSQAAQCPVWNLNLQSYLGNSATYLLNSHCQLVEENSAALGALMLAVWGIMAAMIILRA